jgi:hypothetical protein
MPLIAPQVRQDRQPVTHKLDIRLVTLLKHYAEFIASSPDYIVNQALLVAFGSDPEFKRWLGRTHPEDAGRIQELADEQPRAEAIARLHRVGPAAGSGAGARSGHGEPATPAVIK